VADEEPLGDVTPEERAAWDEARREHREEIRALRPQINAARMSIGTLEHKRDDLIREALILGVSPSDLADDAGLAIARISQIRNRRR
jgi:hypothetical protein